MGLHRAAKAIGSERHQDVAPTGRLLSLASPSAPALAKLIASLRVGEVGEAELSSGMIAVIRQQMASLQLGLASFGELQSITFDRVAPNGWDVFSVRFEHAVIQCSIELREDGKIASILWDM